MDGPDSRLHMKPEPEQETFGRHIGKKFATEENLPLPPTTINPLAQQNACMMISVSLLRRHVELRPDEGLDPLFARQSQTEKAAFEFEVDVKIKKRAAFSLGSNPIG
jgi:hypothetical protein